MSAIDFSIETPSKQSQLAQVFLLVRVSLLPVQQARFRESIAGCKCNIRHSFNGMPTIHAAKAFFQHTTFHYQKKAVESFQEHIEPPKEVRGHATFLDGKMLCYYIQNSNLSTCLQTRAPYAHFILPSVSSKWLASRLQRSSLMTPSYRAGNLHKSKRRAVVDAV